MCCLIRRRRYFAIRRMLSCVLAAAAACQMALPAYGAENITGPSGTGYNAERWAALTDNVLQYEELEDRIHEFNSNFSSVWDDLKETQSDMSGYVEDLENAQFKMKQLEDTAKDAMKQGDMSAAVDYYTYRTIAHDVMNPIIGSFHSNAVSLLMNTSTSKALKSGEDSVLQIAQQLYITYSTLTKQKKMLDLMVPMYEEQYRIVSEQQALGMVTEKEVLQAQAQQLNAVGLVNSLQNGMMQLKPTICSLAGWPADADIEIADIPPVDLLYLDQIDLERDIQKAIGNNRTLIGQRTSAKGQTTSAIQARLDYINEGEEKLRIRMQSLYQDVLNSKTAYEGAAAGYEAAKKDREKYSRMKDLGYLSRTDHIGTELAYLTKEAEYYSADTALRLAIANYDWAVKGLTAIE